ncbi:MAG TPA: CHRD domain-containing protein [Sphingomicrobium sp.]|nr:CHRD domain-containing protein [Sphingomicrobium sp.]
MTRTTQLALALACSAVAGTALSAAPVAEGGRKFSTTLSGANECNNSGTCNLGDPDGSGSAQIFVNYGQNRICWKITVSNIDPPTRSHIHKGPATGSGGIVVSFFETAQTANLESCTTAALDPELVKDIIQNPQDYYVNVHNATYPGGAVRGQLSK